MVDYLFVGENLELKNLQGFSPFKAVLVIEILLSAEKQQKVSQWLVNSGCLYMMAWGLECSSWDDSVDLANLENFDYQDIPDHLAVMTTWHVKQTLQEVFWFAKNAAHHSDVEVSNTLILHLSNLAKETALLTLYKNI